MRFGIDRGRPPFRGRAFLFSLLALALTAAGCGAGADDPAGGVSNMPVRPIQDVMAEHVPEFMDIDGVIGVFEGALEDGTPCIRILVLEDRPEVVKELPSELEGYRVLVELSGAIEPLDERGN